VLATGDEWDGDITLLGFGLDSFVEVFSALFVLLRICRGDVKGRDGPSSTATAASERARWRRERQSMLGIGVLLVLLAASATAGGVWKLVKDRGDSDGTAGIVISVVSLSGMVLLWLTKSWCAVMLNSSVVEADAACSLGCISLSVALLVSSLIRRIDNALWWVDGVTSLVLAAIIVVDGVRVLRAAAKGGGGGCGCEGSASVVIRAMYRRLRAGNGELRQCIQRLSESQSDPLLTRTGAPLVDASESGVGATAAGFDLDELQAAAAAGKASAKAVAVSLHDDADDIGGGGSGGGGAAAAAVTAATTTTAAAVVAAGVGGASGTAGAAAGVVGSAVVEGGAGDGVSCTVRPQAATSSATDAASGGSDAAAASVGSISGDGDAGAAPATAAACKPVAVATGMEDVPPTAAAKGG
jgi:hypothetical protein